MATPDEQIEYHDYSEEKLTREEFRQLLKDTVVIRELKVDELEFLEKNANIMDDKMMDRLEENIKYDGILTQLPFVQKLPSGKYEIISGNHRVKAAIKAEMDTILCMVCEVTLPEDEKLRLQVSHNTIRGYHNELILQEIIDGIKNIDALRRSGADFDLSTLQMEQIDFKSIDANALDIRTVVLYFTVPDIRAIDRLVADIDEYLTERSSVYLAGHKDFATFIEAVTKVKRGANIINSAMALSLVFEYASKNLDHIFTYFEENYGKKDHANGLQEVQTPTKQ